MNESNLIDQAGEDPGILLDLLIQAYHTASPSPKRHAAFISELEKFSPTDLVAPLALAVARIVNGNNDDELLPHGGTAYDLKVAIARSALRATLHAATEDIPETRRVSLECGQHAWSVLALLHFISQTMDPETALAAAALVQDVHVTGHPSTDVVYGIAAADVLSE